MAKTKTYQDFEKVKDKPSDLADFMWTAIQNHMTTELYENAVLADEYDAQRNRTVNTYVKTIFTLTGSKVQDFTASNNKIASNFFHRLNTQRCMYSLGNGVSFVDIGETGEDKTKEELGRYFDRDLQEWAYNGLKHGVCFGFWNLNRLYVFPVTEFVPLWDEETSALRAGIRFWRLDAERPMNAVLYEEDGYTTFKTEDAGSRVLEPTAEKRAYKVTYASTEVDDPEVIGEENYTELPIVPLWGSKLHQSTIVGMREAIDSFDLIRSGFANDLSDCAEIYWLVENYGGMTENELGQFRDRLKLNHIANVDSDSGGKVTPYTQEIPFQARAEYLKEIRNGIYEDFGALDVHAVAAGATNDHIDAAYQPMDEEAADFEYQVAEAVMKVLSLVGIEDKPVFQRNRISNQKEQVDMVVMEAQWLDHDTILRKLPNIRPEEVAAILERAGVEGMARFEGEE